MIVCIDLHVSSDAVCVGLMRFLSKTLRKKILIIPNVWHMCVPSLSTVSAVDCVSLVDSLSQAKQYSYHLRPSSAGSQSSQNRTKNWDHKMDTNMFGWFFFLQELNLCKRHRDNVHLNSFDAYLNYCMRYSETLMVRIWVYIWNLQYHLDYCRG